MNLVKKKVLLVLFAAVALFLFLSSSALSYHVDNFVIEAADPASGINGGGSGYEGGAWYQY